MDFDEIEQFLDTYGFILLYVFITSLLINPFIVLFVGRDNFVYEVEQPSAQMEIALTIEDYKKVSLEEHERKQREASRIETIGYTALLGWMATSKRFKKGANQYFQKAFQRNLL